MPLRAYKTEIEVNNKQNTLLLQHLGCARWAFNWALSKKKEAFDARTKIPTAIDLHKELNQLKKTDFPWFYGSSKSAPQNALRDCDKAFQNFFTRCKKKVKGKRKERLPQIQVQEESQTVISVRWDDCYRRRFHKATQNRKDTPQRKRLSANR